MSPCLKTVTLALRWSIGRGRYAEKP